MSRGGKRPGSGAPKGNINALKHGETSRTWLETQERKLKKHFGRGKRIGSGESILKSTRSSAKSRNIRALKTGKHSKLIDDFIQTDPTIKTMKLTEDQARKYVLSQLKPLK